MERIVDLAIQLVNFNTKSYLLDCLRSIFRDLSDSQISFEINILDNDSKDDLFDLKNFFSVSQKELLNVWESPINLGFGGGQNLLAQKTKAKYLLLLNPDIVIEEKNCIARLYQRMIGEPAIKVIGPKLYNRQGKTQIWDHGESKGMPKLFRRLGWWFWRSQPKEVECAWVSGAVFLVEKTAFDQLNGFDEHFFLYREEEDFCFRLTECGRGYRVHYFPEVKILHIGSVVARKKAYFLASTKYFLKKHVLGVT